MLVSYPSQIMFIMEMNNPVTIPSPYRQAGILTFGASNDGFFRNHSDTLASGLRKSRASFATLLRELQKRLCFGSSPLSL